ncbi:MAG: TRAP transporter large permease subunit [Rubrimonas sp.]|uniref:TRAP transporter large permease n=1 Tax=Rubrimonas sp. TaxID=2036015 RepID=UPI002FDDA8FA
MLVDSLPILMFVALAAFLFTGYPVAFILGGVGLGFAVLGDMLGVMNWARITVLPNRIFGSTMENPVLVAIPMFVYMGTMLEKSGVANDLLHALQVLTRRIPGGLALSVTLMGTIMAATTGIIGASVVMMTLMALPVMVARGYSHPLATGTIAASGTLGILIPPSIMLVIMSDLMSIPVGTVFIAAIVPGLLLAALYCVYIIVLTGLKPQLAPPMPDDIGPGDSGEYVAMLLGSFVPPIALIAVTLGSIFAGLATPTEASGIGALGATLLAVYKGRFNWRTVRDVSHASAMTTAMLFGIFVGATCFSLVFKTLGGDVLIENIIDSMGVGVWGVLFVLMAMVFFLGFFFDWIEITLIVLPVFGPIVAELDFGAHLAGFEGVSSNIGVVTLIWFTILLSTNLQTSFLTPPFGFALFYLKGVAPKEVTIQEIYRGIVPFVLLQLFGLGLCVAFPSLVLGLPNYLLGK